MIAPTAERALTAHLWSYVRRATRPQCKISEWDLVLAHTGWKTSDFTEIRLPRPKKQSRGGTLHKFRSAFSFAALCAFSFAALCAFSFLVPWTSLWNTKGGCGPKAHPSCGAPAFGRERRKQIFCLAPFILYICLIIPAARVNQSQPRTV